MKSLLKTLTGHDRRMLLAGNTLVMAALALAAMGAASAVHARDNVSFSVGISVPGVVYPSYAYPVYTQPPVYGQPRPVYVQPAPVVYQQVPVYYDNPPIYYERPHGWKRDYRKNNHDRDDDDGYERHNGHQRGEN